LDGTLACKRKIERPLYGFFINHPIDAISTFLIFGGLGFFSLFKYRIGIDNTDWIFASINLYVSIYLSVFY